MLTLTARQLEILDFIRESIKENNMPPTVAEIADAMHLNSTNGVRGHLQALARKGAIELIPNASRGIRLLQIDMFEQGLPLVGRVAAGQPLLAEENIEDYKQVDPGLFNPGADYLLRVQGESMRDIGILDGDLDEVVVAPHVPETHRAGRVDQAVVDGHLEGRIAGAVRNARESLRRPSSSTGG